MRKSVDISLTFAGVGFVLGAIVNAEKATEGLGWGPVPQVILWTVLGGLLYPAFLLLKPTAKQLQIDKISVNVPILGGVTLGLAPEQKKVAWRIFVELSTRISTRNLQNGGGFIREALTSLYGLFETSRTELKGMPPSPPPEKGETTVEVTITTLLNQVLRPMLTRWHPRLTAWEGTGMPEAQWPLAANCRADLETTRIVLVDFAHALGTMAGVPDCDHILPSLDAREGKERGLVPIEEIRSIDAELAPARSAELDTLGWNVFVEVATRLPVGDILPEEGGMRLVFESMDEFARAVRRELKASTPTPPSVSGGKPVEALALQIVRECVLPFLAEWKAPGLAWIGEHPTEPWPEEARCRGALKKTREKIARLAEELGELIGAPGLDA